MGSVAVTAGRTLADHVYRPVISRQLVATSRPFGDGENKSTAAAGRMRTKRALFADPQLIQPRFPEGSAQEGQGCGGAPSAGFLLPKPFCVGFPSPLALCLEFIIVFPDGQASLLSCELRRRGAVGCTEWKKTWLGLLPIDGFASMAWLTVSGWNLETAAANIEFCCGLLKCILWRLDAPPPSMEPMLAMLSPVLPLARREAVLVTLARRDAAFDEKAEGARVLALLANPIPMDLPSSVFEFRSRLVISSNCLSNFFSMRWMICSSRSFSPAKVPLANFTPPPPPCEVILLDEGMKLADMHEEASDSTDPFPGRFMFAEDDEPPPSD